MERAAFVGGSCTLPAWRGLSRIMRLQPHLHRSPSAPRVPWRCALPDPAVGRGAFAAAETLWHALSGPLFAPLDACTPESVRTLVWLDFRAAVLLFVISPLALFGGSLARGHEKANDALTRVLAGYWQASALLLCAVLLNAAHAPVAAFAGLLVQAVVAASLNWWTDLLEEIENEDGTLERLFRTWRPLATAAAVLGFGVQVPFQRCNLVSDLRSDCLCVAWTEPPVRLFEIVAGDVDENLLATLGGFGCAIYLAYAAYFVTVVLPRVGRSGRKERDVFSAVSVLIWLGLIGKGGEEKTKQEML